MAIRRLVQHQFLCGRDTTPLEAVTSPELSRPRDSRHTFRTLLDETGAPMKVQQELMRHADIRTTMNFYGKAMDESKRAAYGKVVRLVLPSKVA